MAKIIEVGIHYKNFGLQEMEKEFLAHSAKVQASMGGITAAHASELTKQTHAHQSHVNQRLQIDKAAVAEGSKLYRNFDQLRAETAGMTTKKLVEYENQLIIEKRRAHDQSIQLATSEARTRATIMEKQLKEEIASLRILSIQREEVQKNGVGALIGQLGIGRNLSALGGGGIGMIGAGIGAAGGIYGGARLIKDFYEAGEKAVDVQERLRIAYTSAGVPLSHLNDEMARTNDFAKQLGAEWNIESDRVRQVSLDVATLGRVHGQANQDIVKASLAVEEMTKSLGEGAITAEQFAKTFNVQDPDREVYLGRLKMKYRDLAEALGEAKNTGDALRITTEYLGKDFKGLDERADSNVEATRRARVAWAEITRQIGIDFVTGAGGALKIISELSGGIITNTQVVAALTLGIGGVTAATALYIIAKKILHDETVIETIDSIKSHAAHILNTEAIVTETGATYAWGTALKSALPAVGLFMIPVAALGVAYEIVSKKQQEVIEKNKEFLAQIDKLPPSMRQTIQDQMAWGGSVGRAKAEALMATEGFKEYKASIENADQKTKQATEDTLKFAGAIVTANEANLTLAKDYADKAGAMVDYYSRVLKDPSIGDATRKAAEQGKKNYEDYLISTAHYVKTAQDNHDKIFAPYNEITSPDGNASKAAFASAQDRLRSKLAVELSLLFTRHEDERKIHLQELQDEQEIDALKLAEAKKHSQLYGEIQLGIAKREDEINKVRIEIAKAFSEEWKQTFESGVKYITQEDTKRHLDTITRLEENGARGMYIERAVLQERVTMTRENYDTLNKLYQDNPHNQVFEEAAKKAELENIAAVHALNMNTITNETAAWHEYHKFREEEAKKRAAELKEEQTLAAEFANVALSPINSALEKQISLWTKAGSVADQIIGGMAKKLLTLGEEKLTKAIGKAIFPEDEKPKDEPGAKGQQQALDLLGMLNQLGVPGFSDSPKLSQSGAPKVGDKYLVLGDGEDQLVNLGVTPKGQPNLIGAKGGLSTLAYESPKADATNVVSKFEKPDNSPKAQESARELQMMDERDKQEADSFKDFGETVASIKQARAIRGEMMKNLLTKPAEAFATIAGGEMFGASAMGMRVGRAIESGIEPLPFVGRFAEQLGEKGAAHVGESVSDAALSKLSINSDARNSSNLFNFADTPNAPRPQSPADSDATKQNTDALKTATLATKGLSGFLQKGLTGNKDVHAGAGLAKGIFGVLSKIPGIGIGADAAELIGGGLGLFDNEGDVSGGPMPGRDNNLTMLRTSANERIRIYRPQPGHSANERADYATSRNMQSYGSQRWHPADIAAIGDAAARAASNIKPPNLNGRPLYENHLEESQRAQNSYWS